MAFGKLGAMGRGMGRLGALGNARPPVLSNAAITAFTDLTADISILTNKSGGALYWVIDVNAVAPTAAQVKAGQGSGGAAAASSGSQAVTVAGTQTKTGATGLAENTTYYAYFMQESGGQSNVAASAAFTTYYTSSQAIFTAFTTPPVTARKTIINACVGSLKTAGIWQKLDVLYLMAAADSQAACINWVAPANFTALQVNSPTFVADRGFTGNGTSSRLRTQYTPSVNGVQTTLNSASVWVWSLTDSQGSADVGNLTAPRTEITPRNGANQMTITVNDAAAVSATANASSIGFFGAQRPDASTRRAWKNGVQLGSDFAVASTALASQEQWVGGGNSSNFSTHQMAAAAWGDSLTGLENSFYSTLLTYMQAVGAA
jgi:hypothetical protein